MCRGLLVVIVLFVRLLSPHETNHDEERLLRLRSPIAPEGYGCAHMHKLLCAQVK
ncbi:MAG: hypothetical protein VB934_12510 [Polyangiaceae bacterium]